MMGNRSRDAEAELNLPPGFRFHPTDEELVVHYLCRKVTYQTLPVPIIAEIDLYKFDPWKLPDMALFGQKEWYFFTPRDRKYPNGSRPNRSAGSGYWKATGADKPIRPAGSSRLAGIKKALVFYAGKAPKGVKTNWIMHEYRLADPNRPTNKRGSLRLDDWVLCRIYNKKNSNEKVVVKQTEQEESVDSFDTFQYRGSERTPESEVEDLSIENHDHHATYGAQDVAASQVLDHELMQTRESLKEDNEWFKDLNLDDLYNNRAAFDITSTANFMYPDYDFQGVPYPQLKPSFPNMLPY